MCYCKKHLYACWSTNALIDFAKKQNLDLGKINIYDIFFEFLTNSCEKESTTNLSWKCTPSKNTICTDIETKRKYSKDSQKHIRY